jgi:hypothetical protein
MIQNNKAVFLVSIAVTILCSRLSAQTNPTPHQIDSLWRAFYGPETHQCLVVYNKMTGDTTTQGHVSRDTLCIMRLLVSDGNATIKNLFPYSQCPSPYGAAYWGVTSGYTISRDGSRIAAQNCHGVIVCDSSGSHLKIISTSDINNDCIALSFDDTVQNGKTVHRIVYAAMPFLILRTALSDSNAAVKTDTLWQQTSSDPCFTSTSLTMGYTSVNKNGRFLSFNLVVTSGACIPVVVDLTTKEYQLPLGGCYADGCQIRSCWDAAGTVSFHVWGHRIPTTLWKWGTAGGGNDGTVPCLVDPSGCSKNSGDPGQGGYYWCETDTNYMIQVGDNDVLNSPGCYSKAYIRKGKTTDPPQVMYLGDYLGWPAMWIDPAPYASGVIHNVAPVPDAYLRNSVQVGRQELTLSTAGGPLMENARLINVKGAVVSKGEKTSSFTCRFDIRNLHTGIYFISWQEAGTIKARVITIAR